MSELKRKWKFLMRKIMSNKNSSLKIIISCVWVVMIWRAIWEFCEIIIFPDNKILSNILCLTIWIIVLLIDDWKLEELL